MTALCSAADHAACDAVLHRSGSSFALPIRLLPVTKRRGTTALYAFCRLADDIVDDTTDVAAAGTALSVFAGEVHDAVAGRPVPSPVLRALADTVSRFGIPMTTIDDILAGVRMDVARSEYETWAELEEYCRCVASAVGLAAIHVWGFAGDGARDAAHACGIAFQLTNILRDVPEDLGRGRVYLPEEDFRATGCTAADLRAGRIGPAFAALAARLVERTQACYDRAVALDACLTADGRRTFRAMFGVYQRLFVAVRQAGPAIFTTRVRPAKLGLLAAAATTIWTGPRRGPGRDRP